MNESLRAIRPIRFLHLEYATALRSLGAQSCFLGGYDENQMTSACVAFLAGSFLRRTLTIPSLPDLTDPPYSGEAF